ncbi:hypothetical protein NP493_1068g02025 [Ridgeia piscesae]|uniref:VWFA domain-containing protein n=1 Tax=Ridgeia piscesae TaxID=27915 RepID=A0AAD9KHN3_RIDPI|nr:hypothetical protein NP493_1068g02025 [Ridgeia piscesae]
MTLIPPHSEARGKEDDGCRVNELTLLLQDTVTGIIQNTMKWILAYVFCGLAAVALSAPSHLASASDKHTGCENKQADVIFIIDASGSIWAPDFAKQLRFVRGIVRHFDVSDRATNFAILSFSDTTQIEYSLDDPQDRSSIAHAIVSVIQTQGTTRTDDALATAGHLFARSKRYTALKIAVVLTDGQSDYPHMTRTEAAALHLAGVRVIAIGIGKDVDRNELLDIAQVDSRVFTVDSFGDLKHSRENVTKKMCSLGTSGNNEVNTPPTKDQRTGAKVSGDDHVLDQPRQHLTLFHNGHQRALSLTTLEEKETTQTWSS